MFDKIFNKQINYLKRFLFFAFNKISFLIYSIGKIIDFILIPICKVKSKGNEVIFEVKNRSFGHHICEPFAVYFYYKDSKKKIIFLSKKKTALVSEANLLLSEIGEVIENYSFIDLKYWFSRSKKFGLVRDFRDEKKLSFFYKIHALNMNKVPPVNIDNIRYSKLDEFIKISNPNNKKIAWWKPKVNKSKDKFFTRTSSIKEIENLIKILEEDKFIVFCYSEIDISKYFKNIINIALINDSKLRERLSIYFDIQCDLAICGQSGGSFLCQMFRRPLIIYDVAFPYVFNYFSPKTLVHLKPAFSNKYNEYVNLSVLLKYKSHKEIIQDGIKFENINSQDFIELYNEMKLKLDLYKNEFPSSSYEINKHFLDANQFSNIYNISLPQISDTSFKELKNKDMI